MLPSFFTLLSKAGIACAADADHTIYRLSEKLPVAIAVNPASHIPWERIMKQYTERLNPTPQVFFENYVNEFELFLSTLLVENSWKGLSPEETNIIFLGYGSGDLFPAVYVVYVQVDEGGMMGLAEGVVQRVSLQEPVHIHWLGDFDSVSPLLFGASPKFREFFNKRYRPIWEGYSERMKEHVRGKSYENSIESQLNAFDYVNDLERRIDSATELAYQSVQMGISTFSIEDMVTTVETIVNANAKLNHLKSEVAGKTGETKEIAVVTIPEGVTWIKHSQYARRD